MKNIHYALLVETPMYAQVCIRTDISFVVEVFKRYQSNSDLDHWRVAKKVLRYLKGTNRQTDDLEVVGYLDIDFSGCADPHNLALGYIFLFAGAVVCRRSAKQFLVAASTMEDEFIFYFGAISQGI